MCAAASMNEHDLQNPCGNLRIVVLGKTGVGRSATGNTILGEEVFKSDLSASSVTQVCCKFTKEVNGREVTVIDTPGLFDPNFTLKETVNRIKLCIPLSAPGPHAFLLVFETGRFTEEDNKTVEIFLKIFGEEASSHTVILFTNGDKLGNISIEEFICYSPDLLRVFNKFQRRYHVFNKDIKDPTQVDQLLQKIDEMVSENGGIYTNEMLQRSEQATEKEKEPILKEKVQGELMSNDVLRIVLFGKTGVATGNTILGREEFRSELSSSSVTEHWEKARATVSEHNLQNSCGKLRIVLLGKTGVGKSATGNTILGEEAFKSDLSASSVTQVCCKVTEEVNGREVTVIDTPGLFDPSFTLEKTVNRIKLCIPLSAPGPHTFLLVFETGRFTEEDKKTVEIFLKIFGEGASSHTFILFSHGDKLGNNSIEEFISYSPDLMKVFNKFKRRYHVFNNEVKDPTQVDQLLEKIDEMISENGYYTNEMLQMAERVIEEEKQRILKEIEARNQQQLEELKREAVKEATSLWEGREKEAREQAKKVEGNLMNNNELRILLVGNTGVGKSATGNMILGRKAFKSELSSSSVTKDCEKARETVNGRKIAVIDTPGLFDTRFTNEEVKEKIKQCMSQSAPGPHVFLVVLQLGRFIIEEKETVKIIQKIFGDASSKFIIALFTHGDRLRKKSIENFIDKSPELNDFIKTINNRYHVFNNEDEDRTQVTELIEKIDQMIRENGGQHYTNRMLQEAERAIQEEQSRFKRPNLNTDQETRCSAKTQKGCIIQ